MGQSPAASRVSLRVQLGGHISTTDNVSAVGDQVAHRLLPGAHHDRVDGDHPRRGFGLLRSADRDVQPVVVDAFVGHAADELNPQILQRLTVHPPSRLTQTFAQRCRFALQQSDFPFRRRRPLDADSARHLIGVDDSPALLPFLEVLLALVDEEFADVETDPASTDHRHPLARDPLATQQHVVRHNAGVVDAGNVQGARRNTGRDDDVVELLQGGVVGAGTQA